MELRALNGLSLPLTEFKAKVALEAIRGERPISELATKHHLHPNQITHWKRQAIENLAKAFELVSISRASFYRQPAGESPATLELMRNIDEAFMETPWYGSRQMARHLRRQGWCVGRKRVWRLMRKIGQSWLGLSEQFRTFR